MSVLQLDDIKAHARVTITDDDTLIQAKIDVAEAWLAQFIGVAIDDATAFPSGTPEPIKEAVRQLVSFLYDNRDCAVVGNTITVTDISPGFYDLLAPYRLWTF
jgi:hypothetical protein